MRCNSSRLRRARDLRRQVSVEFGAFTYVDCQRVNEEIMGEVFGCRLD
jgi:hypothetical protein